MKISLEELKVFFSGDSVYRVPLYQRHYEWEKENWRTLLEDMITITDTPEGESVHFLGNIFLVKEVSDLNSTNYLLVDGQQRLTTLLILFAAIRDHLSEKKYSANEKKKKREIDKIIEYSLFSKSECLRLEPTEADKIDFEKIVKNTSEKTEILGRNDEESLILKCYSFFRKELLDCEMLLNGKKKKIDVTELFSKIQTKAKMIRVILEKEEPTAIFESLNNKGRPLGEVDLIRNYIFSVVKKEERENAYRNLWLPMENLVGGDIHDFFIYRLSIEGKSLNPRKTYPEFKELCKNHEGGFCKFLEQLKSFATTYFFLRYPEESKKEDTEVIRGVKKINSLSGGRILPVVGVVCYAFKFQNLGKRIFIDFLSVLENFIIRNLVCSPGRFDVFEYLSKQDTIRGVYWAIQQEGSIDKVKTIFCSANYHTDAYFEKKIKEKEFHNDDLTKHILREVELLLKRTPPEESRVEQIVPRLLSYEWRKTLGSVSGSALEGFSKNLGNLVLIDEGDPLYPGTSSSFEEKYEYLKKRKRDFTLNVALSDYLFVGDDLIVDDNNSEKMDWGKISIEKRLDFLAKICLKIWPCFAEVSGEVKDKRDAIVTGTKPFHIQILGEEFEVKHWVEVLEFTLNTVIDLHNNEEFRELAEDYPTRITAEKTRYLSWKSCLKLSNDFYLNKVGLNAEYVYSLCLKIFDRFGLKDSDWIIETEVKGG